MNADISTGSDLNSMPFAEKVASGAAGGVSYVVKNGLDLRAEIGSPTGIASGEDVEALKAGQTTSAIYADTIEALQLISGTFDGQGAFALNGSGAGQYRWDGKQWIFLRGDMLATKADKSALEAVVEDLAVKSISFEKRSALLANSSNAGHYSKRIYEGDALLATALPSSTKRIEITAAHSTSSILTSYVQMNVAVGDHFSENRYLPAAAAVYANGSLYSAYFSLTLDEMTASTIAEVTDTIVRVRYALPQSKPITTTDIDSPFIFDVRGVFAPGIARNGSYYTDLTVTARSDEYIQFIVPRSELTSANYDSTRLDDIDHYIRQVGAGSLFLAYGGGTTMYTITGLGDYLAVVTPAGETKITTGTENAINVAVAIEDRGVRTEVGSYVRYSADVYADRDYGFTAFPIELKASLPRGLASGSQHLRVFDSKGKEYSAQFADEFHPNPRQGVNLGYYDDGSLNTGAVFIKGSLSSGENLGLELRAYTTQVGVGSEHRLTSTSNSEVNLTFGGYTYTFSRHTAYGLSLVRTPSGASHTIGVEPRFSGWDTQSASPLQVNPTRRKSIRVVNSGPVFVEVEVIAWNQDQYEIPAECLRFVTRTKIFENGKVQIRTYVQAIVEIAAGLLYGIHSRVNLSGGNYTIDNQAMSACWTDSSSGKNFSVTLARANNDVHRDGTAYGPTRPNNTTCIYLGEKSYRMYGGWQFTSQSDASLTTYKIPRDWVWSQEIWIDCESDATTPQSAVARIYNRPVGFLGQTGFPHVLRRNILDDLKEWTYGAMEWFYSSEAAANGGYDGTQTWRYRAFAYELMRHADTGHRTLDDLHAEFTAYMSANFGGLTNVGKHYASGKLVLQFASRLVIPVVEWMYKLAVTEGNVAVRASLEDAISSFADAVLTAYEANGGIPLNASQGRAGGVNSNSNAAGMRVLALAIHAGVDASGKYLNALDGVESLLTNTSSYMYVDGIVSEAPTDRMASTNYLHYQTYATNNYLLACDLTGRTPKMDLVNYMIQACVGSGGFKEVDYCVSESRRGSFNTITFGLYGLLRANRASPLNAARSLVNVMKSEYGPIPGFPQRAFGFDPTTSNDPSLTSEISYCATTIADVWLAHHFGSLG